MRLAFNIRHARRPTRKVQITMSSRAHIGLVSCRSEDLASLNADAMSQPDAGRIQAYRSPGGPGIRLDGAMMAGNQVSRFYDSLLVKARPPCSRKLFISPTQLCNVACRAPCCCSVCLCIRTVQRLALASTDSLSTEYRHGCVRCSLATLIGMEASISRQYWTSSGS